MSWRRKRITEREISQAVQRTQRRAEMMKLPDIIAWVDTSLYSVGNNLTDAANAADPEYAAACLVEAEAHYEVLGALMGEIKSRLGECGA